MIVQCSNARIDTMTKTATVTAPATEIKFPKFDLDALFSAQKANWPPPMRRRPCCSTPPRRSPRCSTAMSRVPSPRPRPRLTARSRPRPIPSRPAARIRGRRQGGLRSRPRRAEARRPVGHRPYQGHRGRAEVHRRLSSPTWFDRDPSGGAAVPHPMRPRPLRRSPGWRMIIEGSGLLPGAFSLLRVRKRHCLDQARLGYFDSTFTLYGPPRKPGKPR